MTYSLDFRKKVLEVRNRKKLSIIKTSKLFNIGTTTIVNWLKNIVPRTGRNKPAIKINMEKLIEDIKKYPDSYQYERAKRFAVSTRGICHALKRLGVTYKKNIKSSKGQNRRTTDFSEKNRNLQKS